MISFFDTAYSDSSQLSEKSAVLESLYHYGSFRVCDKEAFSVVKEKISSYLGSQEKRYEGLVLLNNVSDQCPIEIYQENALSWAEMVLKILRHHGETTGTRKMAYKILKDMLKCRLSSPALKREAAISVLPALLDTLLETSTEDGWIKQAVECLSICLKYFPSNCGTKKDKIEEFLILLLDRWELKEFEPIAECFAYLPTCSVNGSDRSSSFQSMWMEQFKQFLSGLNAILNFLYDGVENGCGDIKICSAKQLPPVPEEPLAAVLKLAHRFKSFGHCLSKMLTCASYSQVVIPADALLIFLGRTLSISPAQMERNPLIYSVLPSLYLTSLTVLESFIQSCDQHLMPICQLISRQLTQMIKSSFIKSSNSKDSLSLVRCAAYQVLQLYIERFKSFTFTENHKEFLISVMIEDMKPSVPEIKSNGPQQNSVALNHAVENCESGKCSSTIQTNIEALRALRSFVVYGNLDPNSFEVIYASVVSTILEIQERPLNLQDSYYDDRYRLDVYSLLQTLAFSLCSQNFTCLPTTISLLTNGLDDLSLLVRAKCQEILDATDVLVNSIKERLPQSSSAEGRYEEQIVLDSDQMYTQLSSDNMGIYSVAQPQGTSSEQSIANESSTCVEMVNGGLPVAPVRETPSQTVDSNRSFPSDLSEACTENDNADITVREGESGEPVFYSNSNAYSASEPDMEDEEEVEEEEEEEVEDEEECKVSYVNHNGVSSEEECVSEEEEEDEEEVVISGIKRPASPDLQSNGPSKRVILNAAEDNSEPEIASMLQDFVPESPDPES